MLKYTKSLSIFSILLSIVLIAACSSQEESKETADTLIFGGTIYTAALENPTVEAVAIKGKTVLFAGTLEEASQFAGDSTERIDLAGKIMTPGFIETHGHMMGLGYNEMNLDLMDVKSYDEMVQRVKEAVDNSEPGQWIIGRGWHQSKWDPKPEMVKGFPIHDKLSEVSPDNPVFLRHASGHASIANAKAMEIAGVNPLNMESTVEDVEGGEIIRDDNGNPTGIFNERAQGIVGKYVPENTIETDRQALQLAIDACLKNGITSFHDAGVGQSTINLYQEFKDQDKLNVRMYVMVSGPNRELTTRWIEQGPMIDTADHLLTVRSIKLNCDGALGSRGAWLLEDYDDRPGHAGMATLPMEYVLDVSNRALESGFQVCSHAIGDRANREVLDQYETAFANHPDKISDHRFRIEHAQHIDPADLPRFSEMGVIAAIQAIHMSSDRPWAIDRLGEKRIKEGAYMWQTLLQSGAIVINGTDVPVEPVDPMASFYASVSRMTLAGAPEGGYEAEEKMTREQALISYTKDAAYGEFEESVKGSIEVGKIADLAVWNKDFMTVPVMEILETRAVMTFLGGKKVYSSEE